MGTSSITRVIVDGEVKVNQYCQFDGNLTSRGIDVLGFVRSLLLEDRLEQMKDALRKITLVNRSESDPDLRESTYTGAPLTEEGQSVLLKVDFFMDQPVRRSYMECVEFLLDREKLTLKEAGYAMAAERRVGNDILPFLLKHSLEDATLYTHDDINPEPDELESGIQSVFTIDMDAETVEVWWQGETDQFTFGELASCTTDEIDTRMDDLEMTAYEGLYDEDEEEFSKDEDSTQQSL